MGVGAKGLSEYDRLACKFFLDGSPNKLTTHTLIWNSIKMYVHCPVTLSHYNIGNSVIVNL